MLPTYSAFARMPSLQQLADEEVESDAVAADDHEIGRLELLPRSCTETVEPASTISVC